MQTSFRRAYATFLAAIVVCCLTFSALAYRRPGQPVRLTIATYNLFAGGDFSAGSLSSLNAMGQVYEGVLRTNFRQRAEIIGDLIAANRPYVIGLQEVALWRTQSPPLPSAATVPTVDFLAVLQRELRERGMEYDVARSLVVIDFEAPGLVNGAFRDIRYTDRNVVLVRRSNVLRVESTRARRFHDQFAIPTPIGAFQFNRGWISVDLVFWGRPIRFVTTHLEALSSSIRTRQAIQLAHSLATDRSTLLVGDFNTVAGSEAYSSFIDAEFDDAWTAAIGATCCQDGDLQNDESELSNRIDFVFGRGAFVFTSAKRVGHLASQRTPSGLWPSDHAGIIAQVELD